MLSPVILANGSSDYFSSGGGLREKTFGAAAGGVRKGGHFAAEVGSSYKLILLWPVCSNVCGACHICGGRVIVTAQEEEKRRCRLQPPPPAARTEHRRRHAARRLCPHLRPHGRSRHTGAPVTILPVSTGGASRAERATPPRRSSPPPPPPPPPVPGCNRTSSTTPGDRLPRPEASRTTHGTAAARAPRRRRHFHQPTSPPPPPAAALKPPPPWFRAHRRTTNRDARVPPRASTARLNRVPRPMPPLPLIEGEGEPALLSRGKVSSGFGSSASNGRGGTCTSSSTQR